MQAFRNANNLRPWRSGRLNNFHVTWHSNAIPYHTTQRQQIKEQLPDHNSSKIETTLPPWKHPVYTAEQIERVQVAHRNAQTWSDYVALSMVRTMRFCFDRITGYKHGKNWKGEEYRMSEKQYLIRNIFLETIAGVPGIVAGMMRHLYSLRAMRRDHGWMETLLEESVNERMHLLTFLKMAEPGWFMRTMVMGAQGIFSTAYTLCYAISPKTCHRFVGYLEEEAIITYTRQIEDLDRGKLPLWSRSKAPELAIKYWNMPEGQQSVRDLLLYIRADEAKHREVNHTFGKYLPLVRHVTEMY